MKGVNSTNSILDNYTLLAHSLRIAANRPIRTFQWPLGHNIGFDSYVINQLDERLGQFITARQSDHNPNPDARVASSIAALFNPVLYARMTDVLRISQQELANIMGLSHQRVNEGLSVLKARNLVRLAYGG
jgi:CRP/FNR family transcriptional regulator, cyclic AMP receptor protein